MRTEREGLGCHAAGHVEAVGSLTVGPAAWTEEFNEAVNLGSSKSYVLGFTNWLGWLARAMLCGANVALTSLTLQVAKSW